MCLIDVQTLYDDSRKCPILDEQKRQKVVLPVIIHDCILIPLYLGAKEDHMHNLVKLCCRPPWE